MYQLYKMSKLQPSQPSSPDRSKVSRMKSKKSPGASYSTPESSKAYSGTVQNSPATMMHPSMQFDVHRRSGIDSSKCTGQKSGGQVLSEDLLPVIAEIRRPQGYSMIRAKEIIAKSRQDPRVAKKHEQFEKTGRVEGFDGEKINDYMTGRIEEHEFVPEGEPDIDKINVPLLGLTPAQEEIREDYKQLMLQHSFDKNDPAARRFDRIDEEVKEIKEKKAGRIRNKTRPTQPRYVARPAKTLTLDLDGESGSKPSTARRVLTTLPSTAREPAPNFSLVGESMHSQFRNTARLGNFTVRSKDSGRVAFLPPGQRVNVKRQLNGSLGQGAQAVFDPNFAMTSSQTARDPRPRRSIAMPLLGPKESVTQVERQYELRKVPTSQTFMHPASPPIDSQRVLTNPFTGTVEPQPRPPYDIKARKMRTTLSPAQQLETIRDSKTLMSPFYTQDKIMTVTEEQLMAGNKVFQVLVDEERLRELDAYVERRKFAEQKVDPRELWVRKDGEKVVQHAEVFKDALSTLDAKCFGSEKQAEKSQKEEEEEEEKDEIAEGLPTFQIGSLVSERDSLNKNTDETHYEPLPAELRALNGKDDEIIERIFDRHFVPVAELEKGKKEIDQGAAKQSTQHITFIETQENVAKKLSASQEIKYVQYVPKDLGKQHVDLTRALKSLYVADHTHVSKDPAKRRFDPEGRVPGYIYQNHGEKCKGAHRHSEFSGEDFDLAKLQTLAFQFMCLERPELHTAPSGKGPQRRASFYPSAKVPHEVEEHCKFHDKTVEMANISVQKIKDHFIRKTDGHLKGVHPRDYDMILPGEMHQFLDGIQNMQGNKGPKVEGVLSPRENDKTAERLRILLGSITSRERAQRKLKVKRLSMTGGIKQFVQQQQRASQPTNKHYETFTCDSSPLGEGVNDTEALRLLRSPKWHHSSERNSDATYNISPSFPDTIEMQPKLANLNLIPALSNGSSGNKITPIKTPMKASMFKAFASGVMPANETPKEALRPDLLENGRSSKEELQYSVDKVIESKRHNISQAVQDEEHQLTKRSDHATTGRDNLAVGSMAPKNDLQEQSVSIAASEWKDQLPGKSIPRSKDTPLAAPPPPGKSKAQLDPKTHLMTKEERLQGKLHQRLVNQHMYLQSLFEGFMEAQEKVETEISARKNQMVHQTKKWQSPFAFQQTQKSRKQDQVAAKRHDQKLQFRIEDGQEIPLSKLPLYELVNKQKALANLGREINEKSKKLMRDIRGLGAMDDESRARMLASSEALLPTMLGVGPSGVEAPAPMRDEGVVSSSRPHSKDSQDGMLSAAPLDSEARLIAAELDADDKKASSLDRLTASRLLEGNVASGASLIRHEEESSPTRRTINVKKPPLADRQVTSEQRQGNLSGDGTKAVDVSSKDTNMSKLEDGTESVTPKHTPLHRKMPTLVMDVHATPLHSELDQQAMTFEGRKPKTAEKTTSPRPNLNNAEGLTIEQAERRKANATMEAQGKQFDRTADLLSSEQRNRDKFLKDLQSKPSISQSMESTEKGQDALDSRAKDKAKQTSFAAKRLQKDLNLQIMSESSSKQVHFLPVAKVEIGTINAKGGDDIKKAVTANVKRRYRPTAKKATAGKRGSLPIKGGGAWEKQPLTPETLMDKYSVSQEPMSSLPRKQDSSTVATPFQLQASTRPKKKAAQAAKLSRKLNIVISTSPKASTGKGSASIGTAERRLAYVHKATASRDASRDQSLEHWSPDSRGSEAREERKTKRELANDTQTNSSVFSPTADELKASGDTSMNIGHDLANCVAHVQAIQEVPPDRYVVKQRKYQIGSEQFRAGNRKQPPYKLSFGHI